MKSNYSDINKALAKHWTDKRCIYCKRGHPDVVLNIEGMTHHNDDIKCVDIHACAKYRRKIKK